MCIVSFFDYLQKKTKKNRKNCSKTEKKGILRKESFSDRGKKSGIRKRQQDKNKTEISKWTA